MNIVLSSLTLSSGIPKYWNTCLEMSDTNSKVVRKPGKGTRCKDLEKQSMTIIITVFSLDIGRSVTKSIVIWYPGVLWHG